MRFELSSVISQFSDRLSNVAQSHLSPHLVLEHVFDTFTSSGASIVCYAHAPPIGALDFRRPGLIASRGLSDAWIEEYAQRQYRDHDPISRAAWTMVFPFSWKNVGSIVKLTENDRQYLRRLDEEKLFSGVSFPVFGPRGRNGNFGIGCDESTFANDFDQLMEIQSFCQQAHLIYCQLIQARPSERNELSEREKDVLRLVLEGQTNKEISTALAISVNSVATYLSRAQAKLGTDHRFFTATRALTLGFLD